MVERKRVYRALFRHDGFSTVAQAERPHLLRQRLGDLGRWARGEAPAEHRTLNWRSPLSEAEIAAVYDDLYPDGVTVDG